MNKADKIPMYTDLREVADSDLTAEDKKDLIAVALTVAKVIVDRLSGTFEVVTVFKDIRAELDIDASEDE